MTTDPVPVTVLTGFLGSGKTTVLNRLLRQPELDGTVAIINEFGTVGLDHLLVEASEERFALLDNGCVCCTVRDDLVETLKVIAARGAGAGGEPVLRVILETTGLADPAPVLHSLMMAPELEGRFAVDGVVTVVDAVNGRHTLAAHAESAKQIAVADRILLTKTDLADPDEVARCRSALTAVNPTAPVATVIDGKIASADVLASDAVAGKDADALHRWFEAATAALDDCHPHAHDCSRDDCSHPDHIHAHHHDHGVHDPGIYTYSLVIDGAVEWSALRQWLDYLATLKGEDLLRFKGLVNILEDPEHPIVLHGVQHVFHPPAHLDRWPTDDRRSRLVFIVRDIPKSVIETTLSKFAAIAPERFAAGEG